MSRTLILTSLFRFIQISSSEVFQDEELKHNNFINLALWESRYIWSEIEKSDVVVSLDTETESFTASIPTFNFRHVIYDDFISRLWRCFMFFLDEQSAWRDLWNRLDVRSKQDFFRLNLSISEDEPVMNEIERMNELRVAVHANLKDRQQFHKIAFAFLVSFFFFKLTSLSLFHDGKFYCRGAIRCRLNEFKACTVLKRLSRFKCVFLNDNELLEYLEPNNDCCEKCRRYQRRVEFIVRDLTEPVSLLIQNIQYGKRAVDGFPRAIDWFIQQQKLETLSHNLVAGAACDHCESEKNQLHSSMLKRKMTDRPNQVSSQHKRSRRKIARTMVWSRRMSGFKPQMREAGMNEAKAGELKYRFYYRHHSSGLCKLNARFFCCSAQLVRVLPRRSHDPLTGNL